MVEVGDWGLRLGFEYGWMSDVLWVAKSWDECGWSKRCSIMEKIECFDQCGWIECNLYWIECVYMVMSKCKCAWLNGVEWIWRKVVSNAVNGNLISEWWLGNLYEWKCMMGNGQGLINKDVQWVWHIVNHWEWIMVNEWTNGWRIRWMILGQKILLPCFLVLYYSFKTTYNHWCAWNSNSVVIFCDEHGLNIFYTAVPSFSTTIPVTKSSKQTLVDIL